MNEQLAILVPTCAKYRWVADFTIAQIARQWAEHPPVFICGIEPEAEDHLPLRADPADWMAIAADAAAELAARGFEKIYVILDDHPPIGRCRSNHLNKTLPALMDRLEAVFIGLSGWGQRRERHAPMLERGLFRLEHCPPEHRWKFSLHPGLWELEGFRKLLAKLMEETDLTKRTAWAFERRAGDPTAEMPGANRAYRIRGHAMSGSSVTWRTCHQLELYAADAVRFLVRRVGGQEARQRLDEKVLGLYHPYSGPYPLFWSGVMKRGSVNPALLFYLRVHRKLQFLRELTAAREAAGC